MANTISFWLSQNSDAPIHNVQLACLGVPAYGNPTANQFYPLDQYGQPSYNKSYNGTTLWEIEFNQNLILQRASARYQLLLSVLVTLFAFFLGLTLEQTKYALIISISIVVLTIIVYFLYEREFDNRQADIGLSFRSVTEMKESINQSRKRK